MCRSDRAVPYFSPFAPELDSGSVVGIEAFLAGLVRGAVTQRVVALYMPEFGLGGWCGGGGWWLGLVGGEPVGDYCDGEHERGGYHHIHQNVTPSSGPGRWDFGLSHGVAFVVGVFPW